MKYGYTIFYVESVLKTIEFYEKAFGFKRKFITPEQDYGELITGDTTIAFGTHELGASNFEEGYQRIQSKVQPIGMEIAFVSENVEKDFQVALANGAILFKEIIQKPWGQKVGYLRDNNGILIEMCSPVEGQE